MKNFLQKFKDICINFAQLVDFSDKQIKAINLFTKETVDTLSQKDVSIENPLFKKTIYAYYNLLKDYNEEYFEHGIRRLEASLKTIPTYTHRFIESDLQYIIRTEQLDVNAAYLYQLSPPIRSKILVLLDDVTEFNFTRNHIVFDVFANKVAPEKTFVDVSPFLKAVINSDYQAVENYIKSGYKVNEYKNLPLLLAVEKEDKDIVQLLVENGADYKNNYCEAVRRSATKENREILNYFLSLGIENIELYANKDSRVPTSNKNYIEVCHNRFSLNKKLEDGLLTEHVKKVHKTKI